MTSTLIRLNERLRQSPAALLTVKRFISVLCALSFLCTILFISNTTPLYILAFFGIAAFFLPERNTPSLYLALFLCYFTYLTICDIFLFPDSNGFALYRKMLLAFLGGLAVFYAQKEKKTFFTCQIAVYLTGTFLFYLAIYYDSFTEKFYSGTRLFLTATHPNILAAYAAVALLSLLAYILYRLENNTPPSAGEQKNSKTFIRIFEKAKLPAAFFLFFFTAALMLATGSRGAIFAAAIVGACSTALFLIRRFGILKAIAAFAALCALIAGLWLAAPQSDFKEQMRVRILRAALNPWQEQTIQSRIPMWTSAFRAFEQKPIFGNGPQTFQITHTAYVQAHYDEFVERFGEDWVIHDTAAAVHAHNQFLMALSEQGGIGGLLFALLFLLPMAHAVRKRCSYGVVVPLIAFYFIQLMVEVLFHGGRNASFSVTVFYMLVGYFAGITGAERKEKKDALKTTSGSQTA